MRSKSEFFTHVRLLASYLLTYLLTPESIILLEKLTVSQLVKKFHTFYETQRFITRFITARHLSLSSASSIQSMPPTHFLKIYLNIILQYPWVSQVVSFPYISTPQPRIHFPSPNTCYMPRPSHSSRLLASRLEPQRGRPGCTFLSASSHLMCPAWEVLPVTQLPWHGPQDHLTTKVQPLRQARITFEEHNVIRSPPVW